MMVEVPPYSRPLVERFRTLCVVADGDVLTEKKNIQSCSEPIQDIVEDE
jgi:hypothetical protein